MESISNIGIGEAQQRVEQTPSDLIAPPTATGTYQVDENVIKSFPIEGTTIVQALSYQEPLWGKTAKVIVRLPDGDMENYFLKVVTLGSTGRSMCEGEYESLKEIYQVSPDFVPKPFAWGRYREPQPEIYFLLAEFRDVGDQPAEPVKLASRLADLHQRSKSPTGKFGFHFATCHAKIAQK
ncbi:MAG: hypothetical protein Q9192_004879, partial [Flavoplaca navasiana]